MGLWGGEVLSAAGEGVAGELMALTDLKGYGAELSHLGPRREAKRGTRSWYRCPVYPYPLHLSDTMS